MANLRCKFNDFVVRNFRRGIEISYERKATSLCDSLAGIGHGKRSFLFRDGTKSKARIAVFPCC